jgi:hypothetical protein
MRGTRLFWYRKLKGLKAIVRLLGCPNLFITLSPADHHWEDFMRHCPQYKEWLDAGQDARMRIAREYVRDNPLIAAY